MAIRRLPRNIYVLGLVSFFTDISSEMLYPVVPLYLTATLGASASVVGLVEGIAESTASLIKLFAGWLSDRYQTRRPLVFAGYGLAALTRPLLALATAWPVVLAARVLDRFGKGIRTAPRDALIADSIEPARRGEAFGFHRSMDQMGAVLGPLLTVWLLARLDNNYQWLFLAATIPSVISTAIIALVREPKPVSSFSTPDLTLRGVPGPLCLFLGVVLLFGIGNSSDAFLVLRARQMGFSPTRIALLFAMLNAVTVLVAWPAGRLSDRVPRRRLIVAAYAIFALVYLAFGAVSEGAWLWLLFAVYGVYHAVADAVGRAFVVDFVPPETRATALGLYAAATGLVALPASLLAGALWDHAGPHAPFLFGAATAATAAVLLTQLPARASGQRVH